MDVLESKVWRWTPGMRTRAFEKEFAECHQRPYGVAIAYGTQALDVAVMAMRVGPGHEAMEPPST